MNSSSVTFATIATSRRGVASVLVLLLLAGCKGSQEQRVELFPASGRITQRGTPLANVQIVLHAKDATFPVLNRLHPHGETDANGNYTLSTYVAGDGAPAGDWTVTLTKADERLSEQARQQILASGDAIPDAWRGRYSNPSRSRWHVTIEPTDNHLEPIDLPSR